jgi:hypothetical protein
MLLTWSSARDPCPYKSIVAPTNATTRTAIASTSTVKPQDNGLADRLAGEAELGSSIVTAFYAPAVTGEKLI